MFNGIAIVAGRKIPLIGIVQNVTTDRTHVRWLRLDGSPEPLVARPFTANVKLLDLVSRN